jgi:hypothetical protein
VTLETTIAQYAVGVTGDLGEDDLLRELEFERRIYEEDRPVVGSIRPQAWVPGRSDIEVHTLADSFPLAMRRAFEAWVRRSVRAAEPVSD